MNKSARQRVADNRLGQATNFNQVVKIDAGSNAHLLTEQDQLFRADVAGRAFLTGKRTATQPANCRVEPPASCVVRRQHLRDSIFPAGMQVHANVEL